MTQRYQTFLYLLVPAMLSFGMLMAYPMSTSFPASHEGPQYILDSLEVKQAFGESISAGIRTLATNSWYPGSIGLLTLVDITTPLSWPTLIIWLSILIHLAIGIGLGYLTLRLHSKLAAAITIILWAATFTVMRPILNGWLAHWWSLLPTVLVLERVLRGKYLHAAGWFVFTALIHPISAFVLLFAGLLTLPAFLLQQTNPRYRITAMCIIAVCMAMGIVWLADKWYIFNSFGDSRPVYTLAHLLGSPLAPAAIAAPLGIFWFTRNYSLKPPHIFLLMFWFVTIWLTVNHLWLGGNFLEWRFEPYLLLSISIAGGIGMTVLATNVTKRQVAHYILIGCLLVGIMTASWRHAREYFAAYNGDNMLVPLTEELKAIDWLKQLPQNTHLVSTRHDLNYKWVHILTGHKWTGTNPPDEAAYVHLISSDATAQKTIISAQQFTHFVIFKKREPDLTTLVTSLSSFPTVFENEAVVIKHLSPTI